MRVLTRALATLGLAALAGATALSAQSAGVGAHRFYIGASGGAMSFETETQSRGTIPMFGGNALITASRAALLIGVDIGLGSSEHAQMYDAVDTTFTTTRDVTFDNINRYYFMLMAYPLKSHVQPFVGIGWGIQTLSNVQVQGTFADNYEKELQQRQAEDFGSTAYMQFVAGVEIRVGIANLFGSLSAATAPNSYDLINHSVYTGQAGLRLSLGKSRDDID
jgi:hypothetical protein